MTAMDAERRKRTEAMIAAITPRLVGLRHIAVGASSPIPATSALLARALSDQPLRVSMLGSREHNPFTDGAKELFDCAAQGRIDAFFLSGGQIDGQANINLLGIGAYPDLKARFPGSFGSAYLYHLIPRVILFREEHSPRTLVDKVDFISASGTSPEGTYRAGGPQALVTGLCAFAFDTTRARFTLESVHPGITIADVKEQTGFDFDIPQSVAETTGFDARTRDILDSRIKTEVAETYPQFAGQFWS